MVNKKRISLGNILWSKTFGGEGSDGGYEVHETDDGGYIIAGAYALSHNNSDAWLIRTASSGDTLWTNTYGGPHTDWASSVAQIDDEGFVLLAKRETSASKEYVWLIRTDAQGDTLWTRRFHDDSFESRGIRVHYTSDGGFLVFAMRSNVFGYSYPWFIKTDLEGKALWTKYLDGLESDASFVGNSGEILEDEGYIVATSDLKMQLLLN